MQWINKREHDGYQVAESATNNGDPPGEIYSPIVEYHPTTTNARWGGGLAGRFRMPKLKETHAQSYPRYRHAGASRKSPNEPPREMPSQKLDI